MAVGLKSGSAGSRKLTAGRQLMTNLESARVQSEDQTIERRYGRGFVDIGSGEFRPRCRVHTPTHILKATSNASFSSSILFLFAGLLELLR